LDYTGIYRYLNDPESLGGAALFGLALITQNKLVFVLAVVKHVGHWWFLGYVEQ
jgi:phosphatidylethanolamine N-methyltransferase